MEEVKLLLFADDMILYRENPREFVKKLLQLINDFSKVAGYKINIQISIAFLYTNDEASEKEIKKTIPFTIASKTMKYLGMNLSKEVKDQYNENYKILLKESEDTNGKTSHVRGSEELILIKWPYYPKPSRDSVQPPSKCQRHSSQK